MSLATALQTLANYRSHNTRASQDTVEKGLLVLQANEVPRLGDEGWAFLEQLALAALDVGRLDVADDCLKRLAAKFPDSPRVEILTGIRLEATETPVIALKFYDELLEADSANGAAWKRRVSVFRRMGKLEKAVEELSLYLDTFYNDLEGWLELADIYSTCNQYTSALQSLSHALILAPQNPFYVQQFAETAYTANDVHLALKMFLLAVEMSEKEGIPEEPSEGLSVRAWWGVKLCCRRLLYGPSSTSASNTAAPKNLRLVDHLATEKVMTTYSSRGGKPGSKDPVGKDVVFDWMTPPTS
ncbi:hypothetical protein C8J56DRAFT_926280 [Mycena floridula]|nr:hypothetical protein C8J56DRAFT_926280 [Mycena floridula]